MIRGGEGAVRTKSLRAKSEGALSAVATLLARAARGVSEESRAEIALAVEQLHLALLEGNSCVPLRELEKSGESEGSLEQLLFEAKLLERSEANEEVLESSERTPLVLDSAGRIYFRRFFEAEKALAHGLGALFASDGGADAGLRQLARDVLGVNADPLQESAVISAIEHRFALVVGGPGTGKTRTVAAILATLARARGEELPEVLLLAPTGKAAARMRESLVASMGEFAIPAGSVERLVASASTIHRALGVVPGVGGGFFRGPKSPLVADLVIVDEASMIDVSLMKSLVLSLRPEARLILLGDTHQLSSVDVGCVLREVARFVSSNERTGAFVELKKSFRFSASSRIAEIAAAIRDGDEVRAFRVLDGAREGLGTGGEEVVFSEVDEAALGESFETLVLGGYGSVFDAKTPREALERLREFRILLAHRRGTLGVTSVNEEVRAILAASGLCPERGEFFRGMPVLVLENDPLTRLSNGDVGVVFPDERGKLVAFFEGSGETRRVPLAELPSFEMSFAMSIHKSQGSEYSRVCIVLPDESSPLLTRELFYTAVTRAKSRVEIIAPRASVKTAIANASVRWSGLYDALAKVVDEARLASGKEAAKSSPATKT